MQPPTPADEEPKYTYGTDQAVAALEELYTEKYPYDNLVINFGTLIRNVTDTDTTITDAKKTIEEAFPRILNDLTQQISRSPYVRAPRIHVYLADYESMIPAAVQRNRTPYRDKLHQIELSYYREFERAKPSTMNKVEVQFHVLPRKAPSYRSLGLLIRNSANTNAVYMISHCPIDYHLSRSYPNFKLVESYTGNVKVPKEFGEKVFKQTHVPFCVPTHVLLGDKENIKSLLSITDKRRIYTAADSERWDLHTADFIQSRLSKMGFQFPFNL